MRRRFYRPWPWIALLAVAGCAPDEPGPPHAAVFPPLAAPNQEYRPPPDGDRLGRVIAKLARPESREALRFTLDHVPEFQPEAAPRLVAATRERLATPEAEFGALVNLCDALGRTGDERAVDVLIEILRKSPVPVTRAAAADALRQIGNQEIVPKLLELAAKVESEVAVQRSLYRAVAALGGPAAGEYLESQMRLWLAQTEGLDEVGKPVWDAVLALDPETGLAVLRRLQPELPDGPLAVQALARRVEWGDLESAAGLKPYLDAQRWPSAMVRATAVGGLAEEGEWEAVLAAAADPDPKVRQAVAAALARDEAVERDLGRAELDRLADDPDGGTAVGALYALVARDDRVRLERWLASLQGYPLDPGSSQALVLLKEEEVFDPRTGPILVSTWERCDAEQKFSVLRALAKLGDEQTLPFFEKVIRDSEEPLEVRILAAKVLPNFGDPAADLLLELWTPDLEPFIAEAVLIGLAEFADHPPARELLLAICGDPAATDAHRRVVFDFLPKAIGWDALDPLLQAREQTARPEVRAYLDGVLRRYF